MKVRFQPIPKHVYCDHYQLGNGLPVFEGTYSQEGHGIFGAIFRGILPLLKGVGKRIAKEAAITGLNVASDVLVRNNKISDSIKKRGTEGVQNLLKGVVHTQHGRGQIRKAPLRKRHNKKIRLCGDILD
jgi:hypothetical protein